jgi:ABC-type sulfate transport system permease subunit
LGAQTPGENKESAVEDVCAARATLLMLPWAVSPHAAAAVTRCFLGSLQALFLVSSCKDQQRVRMTFEFGLRTYFVTPPF